MSLHRTTLDLTVNPDFGQVEADPSVVNLSAYETFFVEKRPFFLEGSDLFRHKLSEVNDGSFLFYSRRVGRAPQLTPDVPAGGSLDMPVATTILGAAKVTGRSSDGWSVGLLEAVTAAERATVTDASDARTTPIVEPLTSHTVARVRREMAGGRTRVGAMATAVERALTDETRGLRREAVTGAVDLAQRFGGDSLELGLGLMASRVAGSVEAMLATQQSSARYFQRPDAPHLRLDPQATSLAGWGAHLKLARIAGRVRGFAYGEALSPGLEVNDLGYLPSTDRALAALVIDASRGAPAGPLRDLGASVAAWEGATFGGEHTFEGGNVNAFLEWRDRSVLRLHADVQTRVLDPAQLRGGPAVVQPVVWAGNASLDSDPRRAVSAGLAAGGRLMSDGLGRTLFAQIGARVYPGTRWSLSVAPGVTTLSNGAQYVATAPDLAQPDRAHYVLGDLRQQTVSTTIRVDCAITNDLTLQLYAEPFASVVRYAGWKEVVEPRARDVDRRFRAVQPVAGDGTSVNADGDGDGQPDYRFTDPSFGVANLNANLVLRWELRPGSTLFVVWSHQGAIATPGLEPLGVVARPLWRPALAHNLDIVLLKLTWWWGI